jgi:hypothetical protein
MFNMDNWTLALPHAMPPGTYQVVTAINEANTLDRARITDGHGLPVHDNLIELGTFQKVT